ncbi:putative glutamate--tRNA ligase, cytoplasmic [Mycena sanguinolenta]|uniref:glutamate--tRNA ligase n=1 Tax=Mycena sanguinolenta TaxID=230812 RepID=A0A8H6YPD6_9AGAR|nr:putative glutamate--tRNA ligase, cytoplasmic [Mycena sanguinolenta]
MATLTVSSKQTPFPWAAVAIASYTEKAELVFDETVTGITLQLNGTTTTDEEEIVHALAKSHGLADDSSKSPAFFALAKNLATVTAVPQIITHLNTLDDHLAYRTFLVGHEITAADWMLWGTMKGSSRIPGLLKNGGQPHLLRWFSHLESLDCIKAALASLTEAKANKARSNTKTAAGFALGLANAEDGKVVTRFPPEPSGYLHIGHAKAAMLNQYFAKMYHGKLIIRFDDTNPSKERTEFEDTILEDLKLMDIVGDVVTHTSDHFQTLYDLALKLIKSGHAYTDDTEQAQMRLERGDGIASAHRDDSVDENLKHFAEMTAGTTEGLRWCLRAKISVTDPNKAMRDPVVYRCNLTPHHRSGCVFPLSIILQFLIAPLAINGKFIPRTTLPAPVVDAIEGVTHALRTNEYRDRNPQYQWMLDALGLRKVHIWDFSRLNFRFTLLSKRKLHWFVDNGLVRGWDDPRFPTVRGIRRRGLTVEALQQFMLAQGPSQAIIDPVAPRHWAIATDGMVPVTITGGPVSPEIKVLPKHKKNPDAGEKKTVFTSAILVEQEDAISFDDQEEITLMDWGNAIVRSKTKNAAGQITAIEMELHLEGDFRKTKKKITWLSQSTSTHPLTPVTLLDYDYLITKMKIEENDTLTDFVTPVTEFRTDALADANVGDLKKGEIMQFERKGYYIFDGVVDGKMEFILIPDGRAASLASKAGTPAPTPQAEAPITKMYAMEKVYGDEVTAEGGSTMYKMENVYKA